MDKFFKHFMNTNSPTTLKDDSTVERLTKLALVSRFLTTTVNDLTEESSYFLARQALQDFSDELTKLNLDVELANDMKKFVEFLAESLENKYKLHRS